MLKVNLDGKSITVDQSKWKSPTLDKILYTPPKTPTEESILTKVKEVFKSNDIGTNTDLAEIGLDSIKYIQIATYIEKTFNVSFISEDLKTYI